MGPEGLPVGPEGLPVGPKGQPVGPEGLPGGGGRGTDVQMYGISPHSTGLFPLLGLLPKKGPGSSRTTGLKPLVYKALGSGKMLRMFKLRCRKVTKGGAQILRLRRARFFSVSPWWRLFGCTLTSEYRSSANLKNELQTDGPTDGRTDGQTLI